MDLVSFGHFFKQSVTRLGWIMWHSQTPKLGSKTFYLKWAEQEEKRWGREYLLVSCYLSLEDHVKRSGEEGKAGQSLRNQIIKDGPTDQYAGERYNTRQQAQASKLRHLPIWVRSPSLTHNENSPLIQDLNNWATAQQYLYPFTLEQVADSNFILMATLPLL